MGSERGIKDVAETLVDRDQDAACGENERSVPCGSLESKVFSWFRIKREDVILWN